MSNQKLLRYTFCATAALGRLAAQQNGFYVGKPAQVFVFEENATSAEANLERRVITGVPFSATAITTTTQVLADGNRITRTTEIAFARDSQGRMRREQGLGAIGPWNTNRENSRFVMIKDPVAQMQYILEPDGQTALKVSTAPNEANAKEFAAKKEAERNGLMARSAVGPPVIEDLGTKIIEGVTAQGKRTTTTLGAGQIGNERPIETVSEVWYSPDLQTIVLSKRIDPRIGETEYKLTDIQRGEPAPSLFEVPAGYTIREEKRR